MSESCRTCPQGMYRDSTAEYRCTSCGENTTTVGPGSASGSLCVVGMFCLIVLTFQWIKFHFIHKQHKYFKTYFNVTIHVHVLDINIFFNAQK